MKRHFRFLLTLALASTAVAQNRGLQQLAQIVPPGPPYDPDKHLNPVITYVQTKDFKASTYKEAQQAADIQLLGLSKELGALDRVELAQPGPDVAKELKLDVRGTFYPIVKQIFKSVDGPEVVLCSYKAPKITGIQSRGGIAFPIGGRGSRDPRNKRFGPETPPEELEIRGRDGLIFETEGSITLAWQEEGVLHTATSTLPRKDFVPIFYDPL